MECKIFAFASLASYRYVVILSLYNGKILLSQHKARETWEMQGGHIETGETPEAAARRELFEESGAVGFSLEPLCDYWAGDEKDGSGGAAFLARITELGPRFLRRRLLRSHIRISRRRFLRARASLAPQHCVIHGWCRAGKGGL